MAVITATVTAIKAITTVAKVLAKKAATGGAKKFITNKAKEKVKGKVKDKFFGKKEKKKKGGALAVRPSSAISIVGSTPLIPSANITKSLGSKTGKSSTDVKKPAPKIGYDKLTQTIDNIVKITGDISDASRRQLESDEGILEEERKRRKEAARKRRESLLESGKKVAGGVASGAAAVGGKFGIGNFFTTILIGGAIVAIINAFKEIEKLFENFKKNAHLIFVTLKYGLGAFAQVAKALGAVVKSVGGKILGGFTGLVGKVGKAITTGLKTGLTRLGNVVLNFGKNAFNTIKNIANAIVNGISKGAQAAAKFLAARTPGAVKNFLKGAKSFVDDAAKFAATGAQKVSSTVTGVVKKGSELVQTGVTKVKGLIGKLPISNILKEKIGAAQQTGLFSALKKIKVPIIGPLIVLVAGLLSGEPAGQATSKALGTMIGGLAGSPLGPIGMLVGELLGAEVGDLFYTAFLKGGDEGGLEAAKEQLKQKWESLVSGGAAVIDWVKRGFGRFSESFGTVPKTNIPMFNPFDGYTYSMLGRAFLTDDVMPGPDERPPKEVENPGPKPKSNKERKAWNSKKKQYDEYLKQKAAYEAKFGVKPPKPTESMVSDLTSSFDGSGGTSESAVESQPEENMMGGSASNKSSYGTSEQRKMLDAIAFAEGTTKSYGTLYGGKVIPELAKGQMTIAEVLQMQKTKKYKGENVYGTGYDSNATGRYQFMSYVLEEEIKRQGISSSEFFTPEMQDKLILNRISRLRGVTPKLLAEEGMSDKVIDMLAPEFASFPNLFGPDAQGKYGTNTSYYGQGGKTKEEIKRAYGQSSGMTESQSSTPAALDSGESEQDDPTMMRKATPDNDDKAAQNVESESAPTQSSPATLAETPPTSSTSSASSLQRKASYEQGAEQTIAVPLAAQRSQQSPMMRSKSRVMMMGGDSFDRYYKAQLLGALYKRG